MSAPLPALPEADQHHLRAAEGWLELGDWQSANDSLELPAGPGLRHWLASAVDRWGFHCMLPAKCRGRSFTER